MDFFGLAIWISLTLWLAATAFLLYGVDFRGYYAAARVLLDGGNPYDYQQVVPMLLQVTGEMGNNPYYYPPWFAWIFIPFVKLPFQTARALWMAINVLLWISGVWYLSERLQWPPRGWKRYAFFTLATYSIAWVTWRYEQAGILVFIVLLATLLSLERKQWNWAGFWLAIALIKPNITLIVVAGICLWLVRRQRWRPVIVMIVWLAGLLAVSTWITPDWYKPFFETGFGQGLTQVLDGPNKVVALRINTTLQDWLRALGLAQPWRLLIYGFAMILGVRLFLHTVLHSESILEVMSVSLLTSYALTPYAMQYDNPSLIIVIFWALRLCSGSPKRMRVGFALALFIFSVIFWQQNISWAYWMVVGSIALAVWARIMLKKTLLQQGSSV
ncbi:MAG TPA: glycosyltransferase family 87 protein [Anaerolineales bacterium]|nr:glycosyltransferase family 87 protein [Anaerolineales bacterium]